MNNTQPTEQPAPSPVDCLNTLYSACKLLQLKFDDHALLQNCYNILNEYIKNNDEQCCGKKDGKVVKGTDFSKHD